jgi:hypothetical protein
MNLAPAKRWIEVMARNPYSSSTSLKISASTPETFGEDSEAPLRR